mmetsp:Transcript_20033/g.42309  ORF Transcript_20033/g.42309 Transcript_20033/m.42309 type:complete len:262 (+) Transcript_20033:530-1315(+)
MARHPQLQSKGEKAEDAKGAKKQTKATVHNHFYSEYGLEKELVDAGVMDPITKRISDPRRVIGIDETPQMLENNSQGPRPKAIGVRGEQLCRSTSLNRESVSICMAQDLNGLQYGPQINVAWTLWTAGLTECMDAPDWAMRFDDQIYSFDKKSAYLLMCKSAHGVQTAETLRDYMANIDLQVARGGRNLCSGWTRSTSSFTAAMQRRTKSTNSGISIPTRRRSTPASMHFSRSLEVAVTSAWRVLGSHGALPRLSSVHAML